MNTKTAPAGQDGETVIATIPKGRSEEIRVALSTFKGRTYIALRIWYRGDDDAMKPSAKGVNVPVEHLEQIAEAMTTALMKARAGGLV